ncbi:hypothetical protein JEQ12_010846 [Ovis aries]|uniref:Uncharacterized protein n=1 Tax=Ovis aries TaxID=9940 RepID=A0A835ZX36_SHEEP|nr:hypothetical protein JEQ12_010846 [Ovis aries]
MGCRAQISSLSFSAHSVPRRVGIQREKRGALFRRRRQLLPGSSAAVVTLSSSVAKLAAFFSKKSSKSIVVLQRAKSRHTTEGWGGISGGGGTPIVPGLCAMNYSGTRGKMKPDFLFRKTSSIAEASHTGQQLERAQDEDSSPFNVEEQKHRAKQTARSGSRKKAAPNATSSSGRTKLLRKSLAWSRHRDSSVAVTDARLACGEGGSCLRLLVVRSPLNIKRQR